MLIDSHGPPQDTGDATKSKSAKYEVRYDHTG